MQSKIDKKNISNQKEFYEYFNDLLCTIFNADIEKNYIKFNNGQIFQIMSIVKNNYSE